MTNKQQRFCEEYLIDLNATQAAIRAGYSPKTAYSMGQRLLKNVEVQQVIQDAMSQRTQRVGITQDQVLQEISKLAFSDASDLPESELKQSNKLKALELLGKHLGMFTDRVQLSGGLDVRSDKLDAILEQLDE